MLKPTFKKRRLCVRQIAPVLVFVLIILLTGHNIGAYALLHFKWDTGGEQPFNVLVKFTSDLDGADVPNHPMFHIYTGYKVAITDWNSAQDYIRFREHSAAINTLGTFWHSNPNYYGQCETYAPSGYLMWFNSRINIRSPAIDNTTIARSVAGHEFGHSMGLADLTQGIALMNQSRDRSVIYSPQQDDINGINAHYSGH